MTNYFKMNNYCKFYCKTFIVTTVIMSDNRESPGYAVFYQGRILSFSQSESRTHPCHVRMKYLLNVKKNALFADDVTKLSEYTSSILDLAKKLEDPY